MEFWTKSVEPWLSADPIRWDAFWIIAVFILAFVVYKIVRFIIKTVVTKFAAKLAEKTKSKLDDYVLNNTHLERLAMVVYIIAFSLLGVKLMHDGQATTLSLIFSKLGTLLAIVMILKLLKGFLDSLAAFTEEDPKFKGKPYKGYIQIVIIILYIFATLFAVGTVSGRSPWALLSGIGAMTAVILLVFKETILSFVSSIQISSYDLVRNGDWISVPKYGADGDVTDVALHTIKIQNWDKTISVLPTNDLMKSGFKNWRGMQESGGRRIKRSIFLDASSIKFMDEEMRERIGKVDILKPYFAEVENEIKAYYKKDTEHTLNDQRLTNIGTFRIYIDKYLRTLDTLRQDLTFLVRQLEPSPTGVPIEIYVFTATTNWNEYEMIQADIFDHLLAAAKEFDLKIFQYGMNPTIKEEK